MPGHIIISHGFESGPDASKATALAAVAERLGWSSERPDYRDIDALGDERIVVQRLQRLSDRMALATRRPLILAGSSMGSFVSARASLQLAVDGLFLLAPPVSRPGYPLRLEAAAVPTTIIHPWRDELIPAGEVIEWATPRRDELILVADSHRLAAHVDYCAEVFAHFLQRFERGEATR